MEGGAELPSDPSIDWQIAPTGGIIILKLHSLAAPSSWILTRAVQVGGALTESTVLVSDPATIQPVFLDIGDHLKTPLDPAKQYIYTFTTAAGTAITAPIQPAASIKLEPDHMTEVLLRALQSGVRSLLLPATFNHRPVVYFAMPMGVQPTLPMITLNDTLLQQGDIPIGQNNSHDFRHNRYDITGQAMRHYTIAVMTTTPQERQFYRDAVLGIFNAILGPILNSIGENTTHRFQVHNSQVTSADTQPGFYFSEILLEFTGSFNVGVSTSFGLIENIIGTIETIGDIFIDTEIAPPSTGPSAYVPALDFSNLNNSGLCAVL